MKSLKNDPCTWKRFPVAGAAAGAAAGVAAGAAPVGATGAAAAGFAGGGASSCAAMLSGIPFMKSIMLTPV